MKYVKAQETAQNISAGSSQQIHLPEEVAHYWKRGMAATKLRSESILTDAVQKDSVHEAQDYKPYSAVGIVSPSLRNKACTDSFHPNITIVTLSWYGRFLSSTASIRLLPHIDGSLS